MKLYQFIAQRLLLLIPVLFGISLLTFTISHLVPADPARLLAGPEAKADAVEAIRKKWGFDRPVYERYLLYMAGVLRGDLGISISTRHPVSQDLRERIPATAELGLAALLIMVLLGVPLGVTAAVKKDAALDHGCRLGALAGVSMPAFWLALLFQLFFFKSLGWFPAGGRLDQSLEPPTHITGMYVLDSLLTGNMTTLANAWWHLAMPATVLSLAGLASVTRMGRASMLEVLTKDYINAARAKGLPERAVIYRHALKNALIPVVTVVSMWLGGILGGSFVVELVFYWPGVGYYGTSGILTADYTAIMGVSLLLTVTYVVANLLADIAYMFIDPRIRYA
ncbi:MAG: ABC transporter permease [Armatimonadetes bacterium]|nr:ABC transporter permease [Armatimonadota bacterium]